MFTVEHFTQTIHLCFVECRLNWWDLLMLMWLFPVFLLPPQFHSPPLSPCVLLLQGSTCASVPRGTPAVPATWRTTWPRWAAGRWRHFSKTLDGPYRPHSMDSSRPSTVSFFNVLNEWEWELKNFVCPCQSWSTHRLASCDSHLKFSFQ